MIAYIYILIISGQNVIWNRLLMRKNEDVWDVYFNFGVYGIQKDDVELGRFMDEYAGHYVFSVHARDLSWEFGSAQFEEWVLKNRIVEKTLQK